MFDIFKIFFKSKNTFDHQLPDEEVILTVRRHWLFLAAPLFIIVLFVFLPFAALLILLSSWPGFKEFSDLFWFLTSMHYLILWNFAFYNVMLYFLNTLVVTNKRIIQNIQTGFYRHIVHELPVNRIQDISVKINGVLPSFLDFGTIEIQSAGAQEKFIFTYIPHPHKIKGAIPSSHY